LPIPHPPLPPLSPYTTLFRSHHPITWLPKPHGRSESINLANVFHAKDVSRHSGRNWIIPFTLHDVGAIHCRRFHAYANLPDARLDRKSTRLNSSHVAISYAVF